MANIYIIQCGFVVALFLLPQSTSKPPKQINCQDVEWCTVGEAFCKESEAKCGRCEDYKQNCFLSTAIANFNQGCSLYCAEEKSRMDIEKLRIANCKPPETPENGHYTGSYAHGGTVTFRCNPNYDLVGKTNITCGNYSIWTAPIPLCKERQCPSPPLLENGAIVGKNYSVGNQLRLKCNPRFRLAGGAILTCASSGRWDKDFPKCIEVLCPVPVPPINGSVEYQGTAIGNKVRISCDAGFVRFGSETAICKDNGAWNWQFVPRCERIYAGTPYFSGVPLWERYVAWPSVGLLFGLCITILVIFKWCKPSNMSSSNNIPEKPVAKQTVVYNKLPTAPHESELLYENELNPAQNRYIPVGDNLNHEQHQNAECILPGNNSSSMPGNQQTSPSADASISNEPSLAAHEEDNRTSDTTAHNVTQKNKSGPSVNGSSNYMEHNKTNNGLNVNAQTVHINNYIGPPVESACKAENVPANQPDQNDSHPVQATGDDASDRQNTATKDFVQESSSGKDDPTSPTDVEENLKNEKSDVALGGLDVDKKILSPKH